MSDSVFITETFQFSSAHYYYRPEWSPEQNQQSFGLCANEHGHGHDYKLEIEIRSSIENYSEDSAHLKEVAGFIVSDFDHHHINHRIEEFRDSGLIPTTENLALYLRQRLKDSSPGLEISRFRLYERPDLWVEL